MMYPKGKRRTIGAAFTNRGAENDARLLGQLHHVDFTRNRGPMVHQSPGVVLHSQQSRHALADLEGKRAEMGWIRLPFRGQMLTKAPSKDSV